MKFILTLTLMSLFLVGCSSAPQMHSTDENQYMIMGESEFGFADMVNSMYGQADVKCSEQGLITHIIKGTRGARSVGFASAKRAYALHFYCR
jgi:PBP1b-binding outer membrane lipoprotein LpoB